MKAAMIATGGLSGGISSTIAGGKFMDGFRQGIITSGLNHLAHMTIDENQKADASADADDKQRWKMFRKGFNRFVRNSQYNEAATLATETFNLDKNVKGRYFFSITKDYNNGYMTTGGEAFQAQQIEITTNFFQGHLGDFVRALHHEFVHVFQRAILGDTSDAGHARREYFAHLDSVYNTDLPPGSETQINFWKSRIPYYFNEMKKVYQVPSK